MVCSYTNRMDVHETAFNIKSIFFMFLCEDLLWSVLNSYILPDFLVLELQAASSWKATPYLPGTVGSLHVCTVLKKPISASRWTLWLCGPETWFEFWHALSIKALREHNCGAGQVLRRILPSQLLRERRRRIRRLRRFWLRSFHHTKTQRFGGLPTNSNQPWLILTFRRWEICRLLWTSISDKLLTYYLLIYIRIFWLVH